ncbi:hypothetical protein [Streptomyces spongiae]|uniref:Dimethylamine monooxygenase subunit DmmA-like C-terminal domain-containing protein n=1 Tax=Streptomyces spongiae TaxID=565072 RepID=A0A5N8XB00_9ACTN|nr:hypothetical protein [Streptomyces spongiae]MPY56374.1 hypothetical protein [Streptomyces spongiae]
MGAHVPVPDMTRGCPAVALRRHAVRRPDGISRSQTNVPEHEPDGALPRARGLLLVQVLDLPESLGGAEAVRREAAEVRASGPARVRDVEYTAFDESVREDLVAITAQMTVGEIVALVGSERDVYALRSVALSLGFEPEEVVTRCLDRETQSADGVHWSSTDAVRELFCVHCRDIFPARAAVGDAVRCPTCQVVLVVEYNFSGHRAAYLASQLR